MNVFVVDELVHTGASVASILRQAGHRVFEASSAQSAFALISRGAFRLQPIDAVILALTPSSSAAFQYESAYAVVSNGIRAAGMPVPPFIFLPVRDEAAGPLLRLAADLVAAVLPYRHIGIIASHLDSLSRKSVPQVIGFHTCVDANHCNGTISEICAIGADKEPMQLPIARATRLYFEFVARFISWRRPQTAEFIVKQMQDVEFYEHALGRSSITKRAFFNNWYRITKAIEGFTPALPLIHGQRLGKETAYAIKCDYSVRHSAASGSPNEPLTALS